MDFTTLTFKATAPQNGSYYFSGALLVTPRVCQEIRLEQVVAICIGARELAKSRNGIDYLLIVEDDKGNRFFYIDQLSREMQATGRYKEEDNYSVLMFSNEY